MPWPVTHILAAEIFYDAYFSHLDHQKFIVGTCFPDIRYPAGLSRKTTHSKHLALFGIQSKPSFSSGLLFHSYVDEIWNSFVLHQNAQIFEEIPETQAMIHAMKVIQDKLLYDKLEDWTKIAAYFEAIFPEELTYGVNEKMVQQWHALLGHYLSKPPKFKDLEMLSISLSPELVHHIEDNFLAYQENRGLTQVLSDFYEHAVILQENLDTPITSLAQHSP
jgi:hypothetical protein